MARAGYGRSDRRQNSLDSLADRKAVLDELAKNGYQVKRACDTVGVAVKTYEKWRARYPEFRAQCEAIKPAKLRAKDKPYDGTFVQFRKAYFGFDTPEFQVKITEAYPHVPPGNILMVLVPPEHGKTTLFEDYASHQISMNPNWRNTTASEKLTMARKILNRVKKRLERSTQLILDFGPFRAGDGGGRQEQEWAADYFRVIKATHDERDYTMAALGFGSAVAGTRTDHLHIDDVQSLKSLNQTQQMVDEFRQDWLSRPGEDGITTINGTRVGEGDFYEALEEAIGPDILRVVRMPAIVTDYLTGDVRPLWPEKYTLEQLARIREKVGEEAWARNYMQKPNPKGTKTYTDDVIEPALNKTRKLHEPVVRPGHTVLALDPALGGALPILGATFYEGRLQLTYMRERTGLGRTEEVMDMVAEACAWAHAHQNPVSHLVVESNAMQKGLARDDRLRTLARDYGFSVVEHLTGVNKYDAAIGVSSMARDFRLANIDIPYADDPNTRYEIDELIRQLKKWRPNVKGTVLRQDRVMALWFLWLLWKDLRGLETMNTESFKREGLPGFQQLANGLVVPSSSLVGSSLVMGGMR